MSKLKPLIDGDIIAYSCAWAAQKKNQPLQPLEYTLEQVDEMMMSIYDVCEASEGLTYLTGKGNYRYDVAVTHPYKGNRKDQPKPTHLGAIRDHLVKRWKAEVTEGIEADDAMGIAQYSPSHDLDKTCICTIDKDLDMIPGWHYNWKKDGLYFVEPEEADYFFHQQLLTGDRVDNIFGIKGIGPVKATKLLKGKTYQERECIILKKYMSHFGADCGKDRMEENRQLLWILREPLEGIDNE